MELCFDNMTTLPKGFQADAISTSVGIGSTLLICLIFAVVVFSGLGDGTLYAHDELRTGERGREMLVTDEYDRVHDNFEVSFRKPPLQFQYYLTAFSLSRLDDRELAVRMWSALYGVGCVAAAGALAWVLLPTSVFAMPLAALATAVSAFVIDSARHGMLDLGLAFFVTLTLIFVVLSRRYPVAWILAGVFAGVAAWQKGPHGLALLAVAAVLRVIDSKDRRSLFTHSFFVGCGLALVVGLAWTVFQMMLFGSEILQGFYVDEIWNRWSEGVGRQRVRRPWRVIEWCLGNWRGFGALAVVAVPAAMFKRKWHRPQVSETATLVVIFIALISVSYDLRFRYIIPFIPAVAAVAVAAGMEFLGLSMRRLALARPWVVGRVSLVTCVLLLTLIATAFPSAVTWDRYAACGGLKSRHCQETHRISLFAGTENGQDLGHSRFQAEAAVALAAARQGTESLVYVKGINDTLLYKDHLLFYGYLDRPVHRHRRDRALSKWIPAPQRGLCQTNDWGAFQAANPGVTIESRHGPIIHWALR